MKYHLNCEAELKGYNPEESLQPYQLECGIPALMKNPCFVQSDTSADGVLQITAWFLALRGKLSDAYDQTITAWSRGPEWVIKEAYTLNKDK